MLRGFTGFGLALAAVPALTLILPPREVVPCVLLLQVVAGLQLVPSTRHAVDWRSLVPILAAAVVATPIGTAVLAEVPSDPMRLVIGAVLLLAVALLARKPPAVHARPGIAVRLGLGVVSGLLNGGTAMAGPPVIAYFLASASVEVGRASLLMYFFLLSVAGTGAAVFAGLIALRTLVLAALLLPAILIGNAIGHRLFGRASAEAYRRVALALLAAMAILAIARAIVA